ncbi:hypothetical protein CCR75_004702 [Bremia lactucae]|uniref:Sm domain-containing protein n=1 Tax=Bremia lactucae TaxID=4779 RepID=A0A976NYU8_BRELC|nr:hypothetical protein CCR75_004702 [Bremia lactucae]
MIRQQTKKPVVLSLNGQPQVTLCADKHGVVELKRHKESSLLIGDPTLELMRLLGSMVRLRISDGRVVLGRFHCFDKHQNVILKDAQEYAPTCINIGKNNKEKAAARDQEEEARFSGALLPRDCRSLGMALVPGKHIVCMKVRADGIESSII